MWQSKIPPVVLESLRLREGLDEEPGRVAEVVLPMADRRERQIRVRLP